MPSSAIFAPAAATNVAPTSFFGAGISVADVVSNGAANNAVNSVNTINRLSGSAVFNKKRSRALTGSVSDITHQTLDNGTLLIAPDNNTVLDTPYGPVSVAAGAVALLVSFEKGLAVYDLHDSRKGAVVVGSDGQGTTLVPGRSAVLTRSSVHSFEEINPARLVGYRQVASHAVDSQTKLFQAEFDIMSVVAGLKPLTTMVISDSPRTRKTVANVLKTAAILMQLSQSQEPFRPYVAPQQTAYAPQTSQ
jgi:hypothetical protein